MCFTSSASQITLGWDLDPGVAGYVIYYGTASGSYTTELDIGMNGTQTIISLQPGLTYYFAIASYDFEGAQSSLSPEIPYLVPGVIQLSAGSTAGGPMTLSFPEEPGAWYEVQESTDLVTWSTFWQTQTATANDWVQIFFFPPAAPREFYRLIMH